MFAFLQTMGTWELVLWKLLNVCKSAGATRRHTHVSNSHTHYVNWWVFTYMRLLHSSRKVLSEWNCSNIFVNNGLVLTSAPIILWKNWLKKAFLARMISTRKCSTVWKKIPSGNEENNVYTYKEGWFRRPNNFGNRESFDYIFSFIFSCIKTTINSDFRKGTKTSRGQISG